MPEDPSASSGDASPAPCTSETLASSLRSNDTLLEWPPKLAIAKPLAAAMTTRIATTTALCPSNLPAQRSIRLTRSCCSRCAIANTSQHHRVRKRASQLPHVHTSFRGQTKYRPKPCANMSIYSVTRQRMNILTSFAQIAKDRRYRRIVGLCRQLFVILVNLTRSKLRMFAF